MSRHFAGTLPLVRLVLRRDRFRLPAWLLAILGLTWFSATAVSDAYPTQREIQTYADTFGQSPVGTALAGPPIALDQLGGILVYETALTGLLGVALMVVFLTVRHTRGDEEEGRTELLRSTVVGRYAPVAAVLAVQVVAVAVVGVGMALSLAGQGVPAAGAVVFGAGIAAFGLVFLGLAAVTAQLAYHPRGAVGMAIAVLGVSYALRAVGDIRAPWLSWLSPMGWSQQVRAFDDNRWWPLVLSMLLAGALVALSMLLISRRDLGAGMLPSPPGPANASRALNGPFALALRQQRGSIIGWGVGIFFFGAVFGSMAEELERLIEGNPTLKQYFAAAGGVSLTDSFFGTALLIISILAGGFAVGSVLRTRAEESAGRVELLVTTGLSRLRWLSAQLAVTLLGTAVLVVLAGAGLGVAHGFVSGDLGEILPLVGQSVVYVPAALLLAGVATLLVGWTPHLAYLSWALLAFSFVIGWLGGLLDPPQWVIDLSPFSHVPLVPAEDVALAPLLAISAAAAAALVLGQAGFRRRDITP